MTQIIRVPPAVRDPETYAIIGAAMEVHGVLGSAFLELVYQEAIAIELARRRITTAREVILPIQYKGVTLRTGYRVDFLCFGSVLVELKAIEGLTPRDESQMINYLVASRLGKGLLLNFGSPQLQFRRFVAGADPGARDAISASSA